MSDPKTYADWLKQRDYTVTKDQYVGHRNFLGKLAPLVKAFQQFLHDNGGNWAFPTSKFGRAELEVLEEAARILDRAQVPLALLKVEKEEPPIILAHEYDYNRNKPE